MIFTEENPLKSPRRPSNAGLSDPLQPESEKPSPFSVYLEDSYKIKPTSDVLTGRNSFCSQGSTATESSNSTFSSATYLSNYLQSFRSLSPMNNRSAPTTETQENCKNVKILLQTQLNYDGTNSSSNNKNDSPLNKDASIASMDNISIAGLDPVNVLSDYHFLDTGLIAYLPDKLALLMKEAIYLFNLKPNKAREFLMSKKVISTSPAEFADFIFTNSSNQSKLSKRRIGEFVGNSSSYNQEVLYYFLAKFDFTNMALDEAIRSLVRQFRLPGEAQQIDRILEKFANVYYSQNVEPIYRIGTSSSAVKSADVAYILSFSILMLNTDLHNPSVPLKNKMTLNEFIRNNRGINNGLDLAPEHLESLYTRIKHEEIKMDMADMLESDVPAFMAPIMAGYLLKLYHVAMVPMWKKRWFILNDGCLYYFYKPYETKPKCIMPLENIRIEVPSQCSNAAAVVESNQNYISRNSSSTNIYDTSNVSNKRRTDEGRVSFSESDSGTNNDCILILYGAASNGLLKSGKLSKTGAMTLAPRSRLVLRAGSVAERDEWLTALQADNKNFDPLRGTTNLKGTGKREGKGNVPQGINIVGGEKVEIEKGVGANQVSRYDTEIYNTETTDLALLGSLKFKRRGSASSTNSEYIDNEGSINSARSFVSWSSDHSTASGEISPDGRHASQGPNGPKWAMPFAVNFNQRKNVSWPNGSPGEVTPSLTKAIDISAMPDATIFGSRVNSSRKISSSSIQSFASGRSSGCTFSTYSDETMFGTTGILLEGYIWRYTLESKLNTLDPTGQTARPRLLTQDSLPSVESLPLRLNSDSTDSYNSTHDVRVVSSAARAIRPTHTSNPDLSAILNVRLEHALSTDSLDSVQSNDVTVLVNNHLKNAPRRSRSDSGGTKRLSNTPGMRDDVSYIPASGEKYKYPIKELSRIESTMSVTDQASLEVKIPAPKYSNNTFEDFSGPQSNIDCHSYPATATSDLTGDSTFSCEIDLITDNIQYSEPVVNDNEIKALEIDSRKSVEKSATIITSRDTSHFDITSIIDEIPAVSLSAPTTISTIGKTTPKSTPKTSPSRAPTGPRTTPISTRKGPYLENDDGIVVKSLSYRKSPSNVYTSPPGLSGNKTSPSFVSPKKLNPYLNEINASDGNGSASHLAHSSGIKSLLLERDFLAIDSPSKHNAPPLSFAGLKNQIKSSDTACPVGVNISMGTNLPSGSGSVPKGNGKSANTISGVRDARKWKKMYITLYSDSDGKGDILFYFPNEEAALCTRNTGVQTQQGYLRMRVVQSVAISNDERVSSINIFTKNELLSFALVSPSEDIYKWVDTLRQSAENAQDT